MATRKSKIPQEIRDAMPEETRDCAIITFSKRSNRYYAYKLLGVKYDPAKKRGIDQRLPLGSIKDGKFTYSPTYLKEKKISELKNELRAKDEVKKREMKETATKAVQLIEETTVKVEEVRQLAKVRYPINTILTVCLLASFAGYTSAVSIAHYWKQYQSELSEIFDQLPEEIPSHDTINRLLRLIDPKKFNELLSLLSVPQLKQARHIHIDGQAVKASKTKNCQKGRYLFNAYDSKQHFFITHELIEEKTNEITHAKSLLESLALSSGDIFTSDAMNTQKDLVDYARSKEADYCLAVKKNHKGLYKAIVEQILLHGQDANKVSCLDCGHGRIETRSVSILPAKILPANILAQWKDLEKGSIIATSTLREFKGGVVDNKDTFETRYFITSLPCNSQEQAQGIVNIIRDHWSIENCLHWVLDVDFNEDRLQASNPNYLANRTLLIKNALNVLKMAQKSYKDNDKIHYSVKSLMQLCSNPFDALETLSRAIMVLENL